MSIEILNLRDKTWFRPNIGKNREDDVDPFAVLIVPRNALELRQFEEDLAGQKEAKGNFAQTFNKIRDKLIRESVSEIKGLSVKTIENGEEKTEAVTDVEQFLKIAGEALLSEIYTAIIEHSKLLEGAAKK